MYDLNTEWAINQSVHDHIEKAYFNFNIYLFAFLLNHKHANRLRGNLSYLDNLLTRWTDLNFTFFRPFL